MVIFLVHLEDVFWHRDINKLFDVVLLKEEATLVLHFPINSYPESLLESIS